MFKIPLDICTIYSPSINLNLRNIFLIFTQRIFSWTKQTLQTKNFFPWFKYNFFGSNVHNSVYDKRDDFGFPIVSFPCLSGDVDSHRTMFTFLSWLDLLGVILVFGNWDFHSKTSNHFQTTYLGLQVSQSSKKKLEKSSGHTLSFYPNQIWWNIVSRIYFWRKLLPGLLHLRGPSLQT